MLKKISKSFLIFFFTSFLSFLIFLFGFSFGLNSSRPSCSAESFDLPSSYVFEDFVYSSDAVLDGIYFISPSASSSGYILNVTPSSVDCLEYPSLSFRMIRLSSPDISLVPVSGSNVTVSDLPFFYFHHVPVSSISVFTQMMSSVSDETARSAVFESSFSRVVPNTSVSGSIFSIFSDIYDYFSSSLSSFVSIFYSSSFGLTIFGVLALVGVAISIFILFVYILSRFLRLR